MQISTEPHVDTCVLPSRILPAWENLPCVAYIFCLELSLIQTSNNHWFSSLSLPSLPPTPIPLLLKKTGWNWTSLSHPFLPCHSFTGCHRRMPVNGLRCVYPLACSTAYCWRIFCKLKGGKYLCTIQLHPAQLSSWNGPCSPDTNLDSRGSCYSQPVSIRTTLEAWFFLTVSWAPGWWLTNRSLLPMGGRCDKQDLFLQALPVCSACEDAYFVSFWPFWFSVGDTEALSDASWQSWTSQNQGLWLTKPLFF